MGSKAAIPIWVAEGRERARPPQAEEGCGLGLWPPHGPGEAGSARRRPARWPRWRPGASLALGATAPAAQWGPTGPPEEPRPAHSDPREFPLVLGFQPPPGSDPGPTRSGLRGRGREASLRGRAGVAGGFWTSGAQPLLKLCLLLSRARGRAPFPQGQSSFVVPGLETRLASLPVLQGLGPFPPRASRGALGPVSSVQLSRKAPFLFSIKCPPRLPKRPLPWCRSLHPQLQASPASREPSAAEVAIATSRRHVPPGGIYLPSSAPSGNDLEQCTRAGGFVFPESVHARLHRLSVRVQGTPRFSRRHS